MNRSRKLLTLIALVAFLVIIFWIGNNQYPYAPMELEWGRGRVWGLTHLGTALTILIVLYVGLFALLGGENIIATCRKWCREAWEDWKAANVSDEELARRQRELLKQLGENEIADREAVRNEREGGAAPTPKRDAMQAAPKFRLPPWKPKPDPRKSEKDITVMEHNDKKYLVEVLERSEDGMRVRLIESGAVVTLQTVKRPRDLTPPETSPSPK